MEGTNNNRAAEDSKEEDLTTKAEALTSMEEDAKEEVSNKVEGLEEAEATSTQTTSTSKNHLVLQMIPALLQPIKRDSSPTGTAVTTHRIHTRAKTETLITTTQTRDGTDN